MKPRSKFGRILENFNFWYSVKENPLIFIHLTNEKRWSIFKLFLYDKIFDTTCWSSIDWKFDHTSHFSSNEPVLTFELILTFNASL